MKINANKIQVNVDCEHALPAMTYLVLDPIVSWTNNGPSSKADVAENGTHV